MVPQIVLKMIEGIVKISQSSSQSNGGTKNILTVTNYESDTSRLQILIYRCMLRPCYALVVVSV